MKRLAFLPLLPFLFTLACGPETMPRPKLDPNRPRTPDPEPEPEAPPVVEEAPAAAAAPAPEAPPEPTGPTITALCEDSFEEAISGLGSDAGLVLFIASEYDSSKQQLEAFKTFITASDYTGIQYFTVEVNECTRLMMTQKISRVPAINIYQGGNPLGTVSMINNVLISDAEIEELIAQMR